MINWFYIKIAAVVDIMFVTGAAKVERVIFETILLNKVGNKRKMGLLEWDRVAA